MKTLRQLALPFKPSRGGRRPNAGRRAGPGLRRVAHRPRKLRCGRNPLHITLRSNLSCLRKQFVFPTVRGAIASLRRERGKDFRIVHFAVQESRVAPEVALRGSHGSGRAALPHPALQVMASLRGGRCCGRRPDSEADDASEAG
jgi:hypothetical protein